MPLMSDLVEQMFLVLKCEDEIQTTNLASSKSLEYNCIHYYREPIFMSKIAPTQVLYSMLYPPTTSFKIGAIFIFFQV